MRELAGEEHRVLAYFRPNPRSGEWVLRALSRRVRPGRGVADVCLPLRVDIGVPLGPLHVHR